MPHDDHLVVGIAPPLRRGHQVVMCARFAFAVASGFVIRLRRVLGSLLLFGKLLPQALPPGQQAPRALPSACSSTTSSSSSKSSGHRRSTGMRFAPRPRTARCVVFLPFRLHGGIVFRLKLSLQALVFPSYPDVHGLLPPRPYDGLLEPPFSKVTEHRFFRNVNTACGTRSLPEQTLKNYLYRKRAFSLARSHPLNHAPP